MRIVEVMDAQTWNHELLGLPNPHVLQSWTWGDFKSRHGWRATRILFQDGGETVAAASLLRRTLPLLPISVGYVPKGPILDWGNTELVTHVLAELEHLVCRQRVLFVKIDPDVYYPDAAPDFSLRPANAPQIAQLLESRGWRFSDDQIQFRNTVLLDLDCSEDELLAAMKQTPRRNIRLATRRGVTVREGTITDLDPFYQLYAETAGRDGFAIRPAGYYLDAWGSFLAAGQAHLLLAEFEGEVLAGLMLFTFGPAAWYMYGASSNRHRKKMPNQILQWEAMRAARAAGCTLYDLWGAPDVLDESDPMWGVYRFKLGLGGQLARGLGAWDFPASKLGYRLYAEIIPRYLDRLRASSQSA